MAGFETTLESRVRHAYIENKKILGLHAHVLGQLFAGREWQAGLHQLHQIEDLPFLGTQTQQATVNAQPVIRRAGNCKEIWKTCLFIEFSRQIATC